MEQFCKKPCSEDRGGLFYVVQTQDLVASLDAKWAY